MNELFQYIRGLSDSIAESYSLDLNTFFVIYLLSFIPFYFGYLLMIYGTTRKISWKNFLGLNLRVKLAWNAHVTLGLLIHLIGRIMPYVYIALWGKNLPWWVALFIWIVIAISVVLFIYKLLPNRKYLQPNDVEIKCADFVNDEQQISQLWQIYNDTFVPLNIVSPCKQSLDFDHFVEALHSTRVKKYFIYKQNIGFIGIAMVTNDFKYIPWISENYFKDKFSDEYSKNLIYYFVGLAVNKDFRGNKYALVLLEYIIDDLPRNAVFGFDHSHNINPILHHFTRVIKHSHLITRKHIDRQHYHVVQWKK